MRKGRNRLVGAALLATACVLVMSSIAAAATPAAVRACVERGLTRYTGPADAVAAQYADLETACIAALDASEVSVEFSSGDGGGRTAPGEERSGEGVAGIPAPSGSGELTDPGAAEPEETAGQPGGTTPPSRTRTSDDATPSAAVATLVRQSVDGTRASSGTPLPGALSDVPGWLLALVGGSVALIGSGIVAGLRKRPH